MDHLTAELLHFGLSEQIIDSLCDVFTEFPEIDSVLIYGSRATGDFRDYSD